MEDFMYQRVGVAAFKNPPKEILKYEVFEFYWLLTSSEKGFLNTSMQNERTFKYLQHKYHVFGKRLIFLCILMRRHIQAGDKIQHYFKSFRALKWAGAACNTMASKEAVDLNFFDLLNKVIHADTINYVDNYPAEEFPKIRLIGKERNGEDWICQFDALDFCNHLIDYVTT